MKIEVGLLSRFAVEWYGDGIALEDDTDGGRSWTFAELNEAANRIGSGFLSLGVDRGDRVGVLSYNRGEVIQAWLGFEKHNIVRAVLHSHFEMSMHVESLNQMEASAVLFDTRFSKEIEQNRSAMKTVKHFIAFGADVPDWAVPFEEVASQGSPDDPLLDVDEDAPCHLQLTTGTTGFPKPWIMTYRSWLAVINHNLHHLDTFGPGIPSVGLDDVNLHFHPVQWASGYQTLYPYLIRGARTVLMDDASFDPDSLLDLIVGEGVTGILVPGPFMTPLLDAIEARGGVEHSLRRVVVFFATPDMCKRMDQLLGPIWCHGFGSTEQGAVTTRLLSHEAEEKPQRFESVGRPGSPFFEVAIMDPHGRRLGHGEVGEIVVRSPMSMGGYWGMPERTQQAFAYGGDWFRPEDVGYLDEDGFLYYVDRAKDRISTSEGVAYPHLVEANVLAHDAVANCGVVGLGEPGTQDVVVAVLLKPGRTPSPDLEQEILTTGSAGLEEHERPKRVFFLEELPTVLGGAKVQREALREKLMSG